jgi:hypothetical protein
MAMNSPTRQRFLRTVLALLGVLLLAAAGLKLYGLNVSPFAQYGNFSTPWLQMAAVEWEIILGLWLLSGAYRVGAWVAAVGTFLTFAAISGYLGWIGQASCGCFGVIKASPWTAFGVDVTALFLLLVARPSFIPRAESARPALTPGLKWLAVGAVVLTGLAAGGSLWAGSPDAALAWLRGESLSVADSYLDFGTGHPGDNLEAVATIHNWTEQPVRLIGGTSDCTCTTLPDLPLAIPPGGQTAIHVQFRVPASKSGGQLTRRVMLRTDCPNQLVVRFRVGCRIE